MEGYSDREREAMENLNGIAVDEMSTAPLDADSKLLPLHHELCEIPIKTSDA
jgi:hypothetical protein